MLKIREDQFSTSGEFLRRLISVFYILIILPLGLFTYLTLANYEYMRIHPQYKISELMVGVFTAFVFLLIFYAYKTFKTKMKKITNGSLKNRLTRYYPVIITFYIVLNTSLLLTVLLYYFTIDKTLIPTIAILIGVCSLQSPNLTRIARHLKLKKADREVLLKGVPIEE